MGIQSTEEPGPTVFSIDSRAHQHQAAVQATAAQCQCACEFMPNAVESSPRCPECLFYTSSNGATSTCLCTMLVYVTAAVAYLLWTLQNWRSTRPPNTNWQQYKGSNFGYFGHTSAFFCTREISSVVSDTSPLSGYLFRASRVRWQSGVFLRQGDRQSHLVYVMTRPRSLRG
jgi:hypothetical protein